MKTAPGKPKFMCLDEFVKLCKDSNLAEENTFVERDPYINFNLSMMT